MRQIVLNLLSNSIVYPARRRDLAQGRLTASGAAKNECEGHRLRIAPEDEILIAAAFRAGLNSIKSAEQGAGLGLPIAWRYLTDMHGGTFSSTTPKSKLRIGTEHWSPPANRRDVGPGARFAEEAPPLQPETVIPASTDIDGGAPQTHHERGDRVVTGALAHEAETISLFKDEQRTCIAVCAD